MRRIQTLDMAQHQKKVGILFELGEVQINRTRWPDYRLYGFGQDDIDDLLELAVDLSLHGAPVESNEVWAPLHAWRAIGQLADLRAIEPLLRMFDRLCEDDWAMEELPVVLAMMGPKAIGPITDFVDDSSHKEYARMMAVDALEEIAKRSPSARSQVVTIITDYLERPDRNTSALNGFAVSSLITLNAKESIDTLRRLYANGNVDISVCGDIEDVEIALGLRTRRNTPSPDLRQLYGLSARHGISRQKTGRNDPCPCGSGKKYKKCCLQ